MESVWVQAIERRRGLLAGLAGLALAGAFLELGLAGLAWVAPSGLLAALRGRSGRSAFRIGYVFGLAFWLAAVHWLLFIPVRGYPLLGWLALSTYLALFAGVWAWLVTPLADATPLQRNDGASRVEPLGMSALHAAGWTQRAAWALWAATAWVALEMIQARLLGGFPWNLLGVSQYRLTPLIQIASVTGVYGVSFLVMWVSASLYLAARAIWRQPTARQVWLPELLLPLLAVAAVFVWGWRRAQPTESSEAVLRAAFVQPSIPQTMIWNEADDERRFEELLALSRCALTNRPDLLLWPEAALPWMIRYDARTFQTVSELARTNRVWIILGSDDAEARPGAASESDAVDYFNSSFLVGPEGALLGRYHKRHLVMFGEYVPLQRWLPFVRWFTPITGSFTPGRAVVRFTLRLPNRAAAGDERSDSLPARSEIAALLLDTAPLICFEDVFPHRVREHVSAETDFLVNLTNDGWFGESVAQWQHAAAAAFRAVENGLPLLRCCNNGVSCWIDAQGRMRAVLRDARGRVYGPGTMTVEVPLRLRTGEGERTLYHRYGDWFGWSCVGITALGCLLRLRRRRAAQPSIASA